MLSLLGFTMITTFMYLIMSKKLTPMVAFMLIPIVFGIIGGFAKGMGPMMLDGVKDVAPTSIMILFAILYFGLMIDTGLFNPLITFILKIVKGDPLKIVVGTAVLSMMVALDGDGTTTYMITASALLPLYKKLKMNPLILAGITMLSMGVMNMTPWGGASAMAMSSLGLTSSELFFPLIPIMGIGLLWVLFVSFIFGARERKRLGVIDIQNTFQEIASASEIVQSTELPEYRRPKLLWFNFVLTLVLLVCLIMDFIPLMILFMVAFAIALLVNYPNIKDQQKRISSHAANAVAVVSIIIAAGIFIGIMSGTQMIDAMARTLVAIIPDVLGPYLPVIVALLSAPLTFVMSNNAFYFGVLPIITQAAEAYGISAAEIGRASILGQPVHIISPLIAAAHLLMRMVDIEIIDLQRFLIKWAFGTTIVMIVASLVLGVISI
ncbi:citrate:proton symporter (plasmid) [Priestia megaterium]|uniref:CitMHS family transporter n=1 Tax=Priestia megaterium TaxID=1404 RepID=UPI000BF9EA98|nr:citrate:proton symporter [Priestia megaterium]MDH2449701.1 citrate:proton symporter [Priestia megaterium]MDL5149159.1 citrate:proton symporter [Priestia megaterium]PER65275.1 citrate transporter [Priestia megaterium]